MYDFRADIAEYAEKLRKVIAELDADQINAAMNALMKAYEKESTVYIFGNGGSAATASHFVCDFNKGVTADLDRKFRFICLSDNVPSVTAIANDCGYDNIFIMQLVNKLRPEDVVVAISGSGNSPNVIKAVEYAKTVGSPVIGLVGYGGGKLLPLSDFPIHVNINDMQKVEDVHMMLDHMMSQIIARRLGRPMC
ncbi:MAG: SIS domain-containing protein [Candidatus Methanoplasma sp.]|jgi:D-sedoheptulose 7-phosphate isomerase|nr:SIS domain-containing protein [Candidatus Methanoplasma sp.]